MSIGTVWTIGGLAPVSSAIPNGRGALITSGTNAPLYTSPFSTARPKAKEDAENHENRLAKALELDRVGRVFEFRGLDSTPSPRPLAVRKGELQPRTVWAGTEWTTAVRFYPNPYFGIQLTTSREGQSLVGLQYFNEDQADTI